MKKRWMLAALLFACALLTACGSADVEPEGELSLVDEQGEEVSLTNKERATILFHFTEVG
ncbi:hypothetical protein ACFFH4_01470 [Halalkalibacter alkalisediminis]|uniref:Redoxin domain-containing protein n=2 Tax=Halalkalibacter alkalisediminis TaxID=935616 RepID=A0ABV6NAR9_9BACI